MQVRARKRRLMLAGNCFPARMNRTFKTLEKRPGALREWRLSLMNQARRGPQRLRLRTLLRSLE
jgi:hypothetical protein